MNKKLICALLMTVIIASCSTTSKTSQPKSLNGEWSIVKVGGNAVNVPSDMDAPFLGFDVSGMKVYGSTSCNRLTGTFTTGDDGEINLGAIGSTRMMCHEMMTEQIILDALNNCRKYRISKSTLLLTDAGGKTVIELHRK